MHIRAALILLLIVGLTGCSSAGDGGYESHDSGGYQHKGSY